MVAFWLPNSSPIWDLEHAVSIEELRGNVSSISWGPGFKFLGRHMAREAEGIPLAVPKLLNLVGPNLCEVNWIPHSIACLAHWESRVGIFHVGGSFLHYYCSMSSRYTKSTPILYQIYKEVQMATIIGVMKPWVNVIQCSCLDTSLLVQNKRSHSNFMVFKMFTGDFTRDKTIWILSLVVQIMIYYTNQGFWTQL